MKIFNRKSFLCSFHSTILEYFVILLCCGSIKTKEGIFATCHKAGSSSLHLLFTEFHLDPLEGLKALLFICSSGKGFSFSLKLILTYFKDLPSTNIIHLSSCDPETIPRETGSFPKSILAARFRQGGRHRQCYQYSEVCQKALEEKRAVPTVLSYSVFSYGYQKGNVDMPHQRDTHFGNKSTTNWLKLASREAPYREVLK